MKTRDFIYLKKTIMKTIMKGSSSKLLKCAGGILMLLAVLLTSCDKYGDDFDALNDRLDDITSQITEASTLLAGITSLQSEVSAIKTAVGNLATADALTDGLTAINTKIEDITNTLGSLDPNDVNVLDQIAALQADLDEANDSLDQLLQTVNMYEHDIYIASDAEVDFYLPTISAWKNGGMVKGNVYIDETNISASKLASLNIITNNINAVIGNTSDVYVKSLADDDISFDGLTYVGRNYDIEGASVADDALTVIGGAVTLDYDGGYLYPNLTSAGSVDMTSYNTDDTATPATVGTTDIDFSALASCGAFNTGVAGIVAVTNTTSINSIKIGSGVKLLETITAVKAKTVDYGIEKATVDLTITAADDAVVSLPALTEAQALTVNALTLNADAVTKFTGDVNLTKTTPVSFPVLADAKVITADDALAFTAPKLVAEAGDDLNLLLAENVEVASIPTSELNAVKVKTLTVNALKETLEVPATVITADITGLDVSLYGDCDAEVSFAATPAVVTLTLGGDIKTAAVSGADDLTSLTTSGIVNSLEVNNCKTIESLNLGHDVFAYGPGASYIITSNVALTSLTTSSDYPEVITVTGNTSLADVDFSSFVTPVDNTNASFTISGNALVGSYTPSVNTLGAGDFVDAKITAAYLTPLKNIVDAAYVVDVANVPTLSIDFKVVDDATATPVTYTTLSVLMNTNNGVYNVTTNPTVVDATSGINSMAEMDLLQ